MEEGRETKDDTEAMNIRKRKKKREKDELGRREIVIKRENKKKGSAEE